MRNVTNGTGTSELEADVAFDGGPGPRGEMLLAVSNAIVRLHKKHFGKGPTKARAHYGGDVLTCVLSDVYTRAERTLLASGQGRAVMRHRQELHDAVRGDFIAAVESITERDVIAFFTGNEAEPDLSVEVFVLGS
jgi:uncharacterized protein YbcI